MKLSWTYEKLPLERTFKISRGSKNHADVVVLEIHDDAQVGYSEAVPYARYGENFETVTAELEDISRKIQDFASLQASVCSLKNGSTRNLLDCALWDLRAKRERRSVHDILGYKPKSVPCASTISVDSLGQMRQQSLEHFDYPLLKVKLDKDDVIDKIEAIHSASPRSKLIVDANEAWDFKTLVTCIPALHKMNVALIEQPLPASDDSALLGLDSPIPICADESCHHTNDIEILRAKYQAINIKLDKSGGLTEAIKMVAKAGSSNLSIMLGCMVGSSLAMAPLFTLASHANFIDLDGPIIIKEDRPNGFVFSKGYMHQPEHFLWGMGTHIE